MSEMETNQRIFYLALLLSSSIRLFCSVDSVNGEQDNYSLYRILEQLFASESLEPTETLSLLKQLENVHPNNSETDLEKIKRLKMIIKANDVSEDKCTIRKFIEINHSLERYSRYPDANIVKYLEYNLMRLLDFCKPILDIEVKKAVKSLGKGDKEAAEQLIDLIVKNRPETELEGIKFSELDESELAKALIAFLELRAPHLNFAKTKPDDVSAVKRVRREFDRVVGGLSRKVSFKLRHAMEPYEELMKNAQLSKRVDCFTRRWFAIRHFFHDLLHAMPSINIMGQLEQEQQVDKGASAGVVAGIFGWLMPKAWA